MQRARQGGQPAMSFPVIVPAVPQGCGRPPQQEMSSEISDQSRSGRVVRSADESLAALTADRVRPTSTVEETVDSILAAGKQGPEQGDDFKNSDKSGASGVFEQGNVLLGGVPRSGKSSAARKILAAMQSGTALHVIDPKGQFVTELFGTQKAGE
ncbi:hypothetical protein WKI65_44360 [Streptomyces sp. MS1.AVA.3]|uniref:hypothetical protein n=1 Tax=Streptomyces decoyicus TaxID=249567 RepID=UPI0030C2B239